MTRERDSVAAVAEHGALADLVAETRCTFLHTLNAGVWRFPPARLASLRTKHGTRFADDDGRILLRAANMESDVKEEFTAIRAELGNVAVRVHEIDVHVREAHACLRDVDTRLSEVDTRLSAGIRRVETTLRQEVREEGIATRRHFDVVAESLRDDIRIIAEGFVALDAKVERIRDSR